MSAVIERKSPIARFVRPFRRQGSVTCEEVRESLPSILDRDAAATSALVGHVEYCLACQAELARYRRLMRLLHQLRTTEPAVPPGVVSDVLSSLEAAANRRAIRSALTGRRLAYGGAVVAAGAVATGLVALALGRTRAPSPASEGATGAI